MTHEAFSPLRRLYTEEMQEVHRHWALYLSIGIALVILGVLALSASVAATFATVVLFGWLLVIAGLVTAGHAFYSRGWSGFSMHLLVAVLDVIVGVLLVANPGAAALSLTLLLAAFFLVGGLFRIVAAVAVRFPSWPWVLLNGIITFLLGILIWAQWPYSGLWVIGTFVGIDLLFNGWSFIMLSLTARNRDWSTT